MSKNRNKRKYNNEKDRNITSQSSNSNDTITIQRTCKVGEVNVNNVKYTIESYKEALERFYNMKDKGADIFFGNSNPYEHFDFKRFIHLDVVTCCTITKIEDDCVEFKFSDKDILNMLRELIKNDSSSVQVQMRYTGNFIKKENNIKLYSIVNIFAFDIIVKGDYEYKTYPDYLAIKESKEINNE